MKLCRGPIAGGGLLALALALASGCPPPSAARHPGPAPAPAPAPTADAATGGTGGSVEPPPRPAPPDAGGNAPPDAGAHVHHADGPATAQTCVPPPIDQPIRKLSETGCVDRQRPLAPGAGAIFYDVASPLWSDGSTKERWIFLPPGKRVRIKSCTRDPRSCQDPELGTGGTWWDEGHFEVPEGTVLVKHFSIAARRIETRLITRTATGWGAYSYRWNEAQTDAEVIGLDEGAVAREVANPALNPANDPTITRAPAGKQVWTYPSRTDCTKCHIDEAGFQLGLELVQLNRDVTYPDGVTMNQLDHWQALGLLENPPAKPYPAPLPLPTGNQGTLEQRARSYLHANCAICHRPGSNFPLMDLRWTTTYFATQTCNAEPRKGNMGVAGARRIVPRQPTLSLVSLRMHTLEDKFRMPQIASAVVDVQGARLIDDWIASLPATCPTQ